MMKKYLIIILILSVSCNSNVESNSEWINLFDGSSKDGWIGRDGSDLHSGWKIIDSVLTLNKQGADDYIKTDIIYGSEMFDNFELYVEWKIPVGGNSGIFYHIQENNGGSPEYQLIDDINYASIHDLEPYNKSVGFENPSKLHPLQQTASDYGMYEANSKIKVFNPAGEWNSSRIIFTEKEVEYWLNGKKVLSFTPWSDDWYERKNSGMYRDNKDYGESRTGYIGFQDYGDDLWLRNIKIRKL
tara:strand:- start:2236 stop:2964 length:729 start_codon:yes stop_codon:yes gene_type:complete